MTQVTCDTCGRSGNEDDLAFPDEECPDEDCDGTCYMEDPAGEIAESFVNGNISWARDQIRAASDPALMALMVANRLDEDDRVTLFRALERSAR